RRFSSTEQTSETLRWYLDLAGFTHGYQFYIVCAVSTGFPNVPTPVTDNTPEPVSAEVLITGDMYVNGGMADVEVTILDWHGIDYVTVDIESPALFDSTVSLEYVGPGVEPDTYIYTGQIGSFNHAPAGEYLCLINAYDGFAAKGIYTTAKVTIHEAVDLQFDDVFFDFSTLDVKEIHVTGLGFGNEQGANIVWLDDETTGFTVSEWGFDDIAIQISNDNLDHVLQFEIDSVLCDPIPIPESESILLVFNPSNSDSVSIKDYYISDITGRNIKNDMICELDLTLGESISRTQYNEQIRTPVEDFIESNNLKNRIKYIVLTKGIPLKISPTHGTDYNDLDYAAVDSELSLIFSEEYNLDGRIFNPYYGKPDGNWFHPFKYKMGTAVVAYLVTRLAAWEVEEVYGMIDRALDPYSGPDAYAILDGGKTYDRMELAADIYVDRGIQHLFENAEIFLTAETIDNPSISDNVLGYTGHGIHHSPAPPGGGLYVFELGFGLLNGAIFNTYESSNCTTFNEASRSGMGMVGDWIRIGGTGGIGHVYEPWSDAVGDERFLYPRQVSKHNLAEACYMALRYVSWTETVVGDPLCIVDIQ
ncbi:MAG: TIGR03790 family protein, partial [Methanosarcinaceae archaeon]|nr:TIGR03790 family protein [Methanosarcinaceae archaeon]